MISPPLFFFFFFFNDTATTEIYTLSLHDALPIFISASNRSTSRPTPRFTISVCRASTSSWSRTFRRAWKYGSDRKSTRLNSSHVRISYAVFCLKKKKKQKNRTDADLIVVCGEG